MYGVVIYILKLNHISLLLLFVMVSLMVVSSVIPESFAHENTNSFFTISDDTPELNDIVTLSCGSDKLSHNIILDVSIDGKNTNILDEQTHLNTLDYSYTFNKYGDYKFRCSYSPEHDMEDNPQTFKKTISLSIIDSTIITSPIIKIIDPADNNPQVILTISNDTPLLGETVTISCSSKGITDIDFYELDLTYFTSSYTRMSVLTFSFDDMINYSYTFEDIGNYIFQCFVHDANQNVYSAESNIIIDDSANKQLSSSPTSSPSGNSETKNNNDGGCSGDCTPPTIGVNKDGIRMVDNGLILNGEIFDVNNFKNHMPMQYTEINKQNHLEVKLYENSGAYAIEKIRFGIVKEIGSPINLFEPRLEIDIENFADDVDNASLQGVKIVDKKGIIDKYKVELSLVDCMEDSFAECLKLDIFWSFAKVPEHNVLVINGWDDKKNAFNNYFNDGITVIDPNYVETIPDTPIKIIELSNRQQSLILEEKRAVLVFDASELISILDDSWTHTIPDGLEKQKALEERMASEADRAEKELQAFFDYIYLGKVHD